MTGSLQVGKGRTTDFRGEILWELVWQSLIGYFRENSGRIRLVMILVTMVVSSIGSSELGNGEGHELTCLCLNDVPKTPAMHNGRKITIN